MLKKLPGWAMIVLAVSLSLTETCDAATIVTSSLTLGTTPPTQVFGLFQSPVTTLDAMLAKSRRVSKRSTSDPGARERTGDELGRADRPTPRNRIGHFIRISLQGSKI